MQLFGHHIHGRLNGDGGLVDAVAPECAALQVVVADRGALYLDVFNHVRTAAHQGAGHQGPVALTLVGAAVREHTAVQIVKFSLRRKADLIVGVVAVALGGEDQILFPAQRHFDGLAADTGSHRHGGFQEGVALFAEAAAQRGSHHADLSFWPVHDLRQHPADLKGRLGAGIHRDVITLHISNGGDGLHTGVLLRLDLLGHLDFHNAGGVFRRFHGVRV